MLFSIFFSCVFRLLLVPIQSVIILSASDFSLLIMSIYWNGFQVPFPFCFELTSMSGGLHLDFPGEDIVSCSIGKYFILASSWLIFLNNLPTCCFTNSLSGVFTGR